jgi:predicted RND superfamily exporter protein
MGKVRISPLAAVFLLVAIFSASVYSLFYLQVDNSPEVYLPEDVPTVIFDKKLREVFPNDQVLVVVFQGDGLFDRSFLKALDQATRKLQSSPLVERVVTVTSADHISGSDDDFFVGPLIDPDSDGNLQGNDFRERALADRFAPGLIVSKDASALSMVVRPVALKGSMQRLALLREVKAAIATAGISDKVSGLAGQVALDVAELKSMIRDTIVFIPLTTVVGLLLIWWLFRRVLAVVLAGVSIGTVVFMAVAIVVIWGRPYTLVASIIPPFMAALTTALLIHLFNSLRHASTRGYCGAERVAYALAEVRRPAFYTCLTTSVGLFSLGLNPIMPIQTFGIAAGAAVLLMYPIVIGLLPPMLSAWDKRSWPSSMGSVKVFDRLVFNLARLAMRHAGWVLVFFAVGLVLGVPQISRIHAETDMYNFFTAKHPLTVATRLVEQKFSGVTTVEVVFDAQHRDDLKQPFRLKALNRFQTWLDTLPQVDRTFCMADVIEEMNWAFHGEREQYRVIPENAQLISQYLFIYSGKDLYEVVDDNFKRTRLTLNLNVTGSNEIRHVVNLIRSHLKEYPVADLDWKIVGYGRLFVDQEDLLVQGQVRSLWVAVGMIFVMFLMLWRSFSGALLCMVPNISPVLVIFIYMGTFGIWLDMATAMIASVALGVAVDDTIHIYNSYIRRRRAGARTVVALMRSYSQVGRAIMATTLILCSQLLLLCASDFIPTTEFGLLTSLGLLAALLFDLLLLPALLVVLNKKA